MIDLYSWPTPNGVKITIMLEETALPYTAHPIDITKGEQFADEFLSISPNNKIPALVDHDGPGGDDFTLFESGAILMYLAEKTGQFMPSAMTDRYQVIQWLMFQMGGVGPMFGQANHFRKYAPEQINYAVQRYTNEAKRLYGVMNKQLSHHEYLAGDYSIADMATYPWVRSYQGYKDGLFDEFSHVKRWFETIDNRPAVQKGLTVLKEHKVEIDKLGNDAFSTLFGDKQYASRK
ncbi:MAG: glutathione S-transferase N-terminal domain-containing protein [Rhodospirillales bacterium]